jgi:hypothetical protein
MQTNAAKESHGILVDKLLQLFSRFEIGDAFGRDVDRFTSLGVSPPARAALTYAKAAEATQLDFLAVVQTVDDAFEYNLDESLGVFLRQLRGISYIVDEIGFSHAVTSLRKRHLLIANELTPNSNSSKGITDYLSRTARCGQDPNYCKANTLRLKEKP